MLLEFFDLFYNDVNFWIRTSNACKLVSSALSIIVAILLDEFSPHLKFYGTRSVIYDIKCLLLKH